ncbi:porin family protein [Hymenobacter psychrophilus]|uniref:Outer membrane protein beta-barrel domain-containing protein n=1 Tax=Hymenobacter psychrophilus TaxID=651662 RepID=A0A1H3B3I4_9BACT|nr:outer membrane beta-barrel protein [Hymenobacter psychrophilus]SDX35964.1 Outer membrane protein beta-barrel domain-containing protein [Hymenobacter psychrophilus]
MTEKDSDHFYRDLRRKLEPYGSPPPESVWAGIQQQLPPQRPSWLRRLMPLGLLAVLLVSITVTSTYWRPFFQKEPAEHAAATVARAPERSTAGRASNPLSNTVEPSTDSPLTGATAADSDAATSINDFDTPPSPAIGAGSDSGVNAGADASPATRAARSSNTLPGNGFNLPTIRPGNRHQANRPAAAATDQPTQFAGVAKHRNQPQRTANEQQPTTLALVRNRPMNRRGRGAKASNRPADRQGRATPASDLAGLAATFSNEPLARRPLPTPPQPAVPKVSSRPLPRPPRPTRQELRLRNWSVQLTAGPSLTYRLLGSASTQLEKLERPAWSGSGQLMGAYAFSPRLTVAGGLGFAQYANTLRYTLSNADSAKTRQIDFRDTYNFITIPVQAQLTLGGNHRWRYGVLGGGTAALLTSMRVTEGSACNCGQRLRRPTPTDTAYRRLNLALTVGAFADYQFAPGQWLTIRPQGELFLNSLTTPNNRAPRHPFSVGVQLGYRWNLDPRKH